MQGLAPPGAHGEGTPQGPLFRWGEGSSPNGPPYYAGWGPSGAPQETGGFALGEWRSGRKSNGAHPAHPGGLFRGGPYEGAPQRAPIQFRVSSPTPSVPSQSGLGGPFSPNGGGTGTPSPVFGLTHAGLHGAPQHPPLAMHFIKGAADAIRWVLQRRRSGVGVPHGGPPSVGAPQQYTWGAPGAPMFSGPQQQQQLHMLPQSRSKEAVEGPRKVFPSVIGLRPAPGEEHGPFPAAAAAGAAEGAAAAAAPSENQRPLEGPPVRQITASVEGSPRCGCRPRSRSGP